MSARRAATGRTSRWTTQSIDPRPATAEAASTRGHPIGAHPVGAALSPGCGGPVTGARQAARPGTWRQLLLASVCGAYAVGAAFGWGSEQLALVMGDFGLAAAALTAGASCLWYATKHRDEHRDKHRDKRRDKQGDKHRDGAPGAAGPSGAPGCPGDGRGRHGEGHATGRPAEREVARSASSRPAWLLFGLASLMLGLGNAVWGWYEVVLSQPVPQPSLADFCFLLFAPFAIVGLLVLAKRPVTRAGWVCLGLDTWLIGGSLLTLSWTLALAHTAPWEGGSVLRAALNLAYPMLDIVLVSMVLVLHFRRNSAHRTAVNTAIGALALTVLCDALFTSPLLRENYSSGQLLDAGWFAGSLLLAYAPWVGHSEEEARASGASTGEPTGAEWAPRGAPPSRPIAGSLAALTPYLAAAVCTLGILYHSLDGQEIDSVVLFTACTVVLALVVRQGIMLLDNITLTHELAQKENHFRSLVQGSSDVIMIAAATGALRYVSPAAAGVYGRDADRLVGCELASLIHPDDLGEVVHELRRFLAAPPEQESATRIECRFRHGAGHWLNIESTVNRYQGGLIFNSRDVTERVRLQAQLQHSASHDALTDLPNRSLFTERVGGALTGRRGGDGDTSVLFIDLDGFKAVNDTHGHQAGDELLVQAARRLRDSVRAGDTAARLGGDEFAVLIVGDSDTARLDATERELRVQEIADRLRLTLSEPYLVEGVEMRVAASIGVAFAEPGISPTALMRNADLAMYRAKQTGKGRVVLYAPQLEAEVVGRTELAARLHGALHDGEFALLHQPIAELSTGRITAVAAQARWRSAQGLLFSPAEFLNSRGSNNASSGNADSRGGARSAPAAGVGAGRGADVDRWLLDEAVKQAAVRHAAGLAAPVTIRVPARLLTQGSGPGTAASRIEALISRNGLPPGALILGLCELDAKVPVEELERRLGMLRRLGVCIALDSQGGGSQLLAALCRLPIDILRLDRGLVEGVLESPRQRKITAGLLRIASDLGLATVADGVDLPEQAAVLREMGCTHGQGAVFSGPLDEHRLRRALLRGGYPVPEPAPVAGASGGAGGGPAGGGGTAHPGSRSMVVAGAVPMGGAVPAQARQGSASGVWQSGTAAACGAWQAGSAGAWQGGSPGVRQGGGLASEPIAHPPPVRPNAETPVPPT